MAETPKYSVSRKQNEIEIRQFPGYIQAEVIVEDANYKSAIEKGFNFMKRLTCRWGSLNYPGE